MTGAPAGDGAPRLLLDRRGAVAVLSISNPGKRNALHPALRIFDF